MRNYYFGTSLLSEIRQIMDPREELTAYRRMAELEAKAAGGQATQEAVNPTDKGFIQNRVDYWKNSIGSLGKSETWKNFGHEFIVCKNLNYCSCI